MTSRSWGNHLTNLHTDGDGNKNLVSYSNALSSDLPEEEKIRNLTENVNDVVAGVDAENNIMIFHSIVNLGGTRARAANKIVALIGMDQLTSCVETMTSSALADCNFDAPSLTAYKKCKDTKELANLTTDGDGTFKGSSMFILAPFVRDAVVGADTNDPLKLIPIVIHAGEQFDKDNAVLDDNYERGIDHAEVLADWLWGAYQKKVPETRFVLRQNDGELMQHAEKRNRECIVPSLRDAEGAPLSSRDTNDVLAQLAAGISRQNTATETSNSLVREELERKKGKDEKKDRLSKLHPTFRNMILNAASECGDRIAEAVPDSCQAFFDQETLGLAEQQLHIQFREFGLSDVGFASGVVQAFLSGRLLYFEPGIPNNFSCFTFKEKLSCKYDGERSLILHLREKDGKVRTNEEINESLQQVVTAPTNYTQMVEQMQIFTVLNKIFVGANGKSTRGLGDLVKRMKRNASTLKHMISSDPTYPAQICLSVDKRVQRWLAQCEVADDRTEVNDRVVDFDNLFEDLLDGRFFCKLPAVFKVRAPLQPPTVSNPFDQERDRSGRGKKRGVDKVDGGRINNESMIKEFKMKENES